ncbi:MAG: AAA family ATPase, partial [Cellulomonadaceae bacterium]
LGETGVVGTTLGDLVPGLQARAEDSGAVARLKGDLGFVAILRRAVRARQRVPERDVAVVIDGTELTIRRDDVAEAIAKARRTHKPHNLARIVFVRDMLNRLAAQFSALQPYEIEAGDRGEVLEELRSNRDVRITLNLAWMPLTPQRLVEDLFTKPYRLAQAAPELSQRDRAALARERGSAWTVADVPLIDEAAELLGEDDQAARAEARAERSRRSAELDYAQQVLESSGAGALVSAELLADRFASRGPSLTTAERAASDRSWTYGHVVVDEAQELSAMAWRALLRRCPTQSLTIVGDVAQTSNLAGARSWSAMLGSVLRPGWRTAELTVNYRTPAVIAATAQAVASDAGLPISTVASARDVPDALSVRHLAGEQMLAGIVETAAVLAHATVGPDGSGRVAVIAPAARTAAIRAALLPRLGDLLSADRAGDAPVSVLTAREAKGLEYDAVLLVEPAELATASDLYVAMTRPTRRLEVLWSHDLPAGLDPVVDGSSGHDPAISTAH